MNGPAIFQLDSDDDDVLDDFDFNVVDDFKDGTGNGTNNADTDDEGEVPQYQCQTDLFIVVALG